MIFGVCAWLGDHFGINPLWFRAGFLFLSFVYGGGILLYLILALIMYYK